MTIASRFASEYRCAMKSALLVALALFVCACAPATRLILKPATREQPAPKADTATIIVGNIANWKVLNLLDERGNVVGQLTGRSHTILFRPAGPMKLYVVPEKEGKWGDRVTGDLEAGRVYYVKVGMRYGGVQAVTLSERNDSDEWKNRKTYVSDLERMDVDPMQVPALSTDLGDVKGLMNQVDEFIAGLTNLERAVRTFEVADGEK